MIWMWYLFVLSAFLTPAHEQGLQLRAFTGYLVYYNQLDYLMSAITASKNLDGCSARSVESASSDFSHRHVGPRPSGIPEKNDLMTGYGKMALLYAVVCLALVNFVVADCPSGYYIYQRYTTGCSSSPSCGGNKFVSSSDGCTWWFWPYNERYYTCDVCSSCPGISCSSGNYVAGCGGGSAGTCTQCSAGTYSLYGTGKKKFSRLRSKWIVNIQSPCEIFFNRTTRGVFLRSCCFFSSQGVSRVLRATIAAQVLLLVSSYIHDWFNWKVDLKKSF